METPTLEQARQNVLFGINTHFQGTKQQWQLMELSLKVCGIEPVLQTAEPAEVSTNGAAVPS